MVRFLSLFFVFASLFLISGNDAYAQKGPPGSKSPIASADTVNPSQCDTLRAAAPSSSKGMLGNMMNSGGAICPCAPYPSVWIERIIFCFAAKPDGLIYNSVGRIMTDGPYKTFYETMVYGTILFALVLFGLNLVLGSIRDLPKESFTLIFKIAGVVLFFNQFFEIYGAALDIIQTLSEIVSTAAGEIGNICEDMYQGTAAGTSPTIWARWDCLFSKFTGLVGTSYLVTGIIGFSTGFFFEGGPAMAVYFGIGYVLMAILLIAMRMVYTYLVAIMAVSFLLLLAPLFVPMILFNYTYQTFSSWFKLIIAYLLQPMLLLLFSVLMLTAFEYAIFVGPTSLFASLTGQTSTNNYPKKAMNFSDVMSKATGGAVTDSKSFMAFINQEQIFSFQQTTSTETNTTNQNAPDAMKPLGQKTGVLGPQHQTSGDTHPDASHEGGFKVPKIDLAGLAAHFGTDEATWLRRVMIQITASAILVFVLYNLVVTAPEITHDMLAQNLRNAGITKGRMIGEGEIKKGLAAAKEVGRRAAQDPNNSFRKAMDDVSNEVADGYIGKRGGPT